ncbi:hypothetical protein [Pseudomonas batumici]|nr:hypothetical protein [Pseudomonas batumici]
MAENAEARMKPITTLSTGNRGKILGDLVREQEEKEALGLEAKVRG